METTMAPRAYRLGRRAETADDTRRRIVVATRVPSGLISAHHRFPVWRIAGAIRLAPEKDHSCAV